MNRISDLIMNRSLNNLTMQTGEIERTEYNSGRAAVTVTEQYQQEHVHSIIFSYNIITEEKTYSLEQNIIAKKLSVFIHEAGYLYHILLTISSPTYCMTNLIAF